VKSASHLVRPVRCEISAQDVVSSHRLFSIVLGLSTTLRARSEGINPHQSLDPVKPTGQAILKDIPPYAARAIGPVADFEARLDRRDKLGMVVLAGAGRVVEPSLEARTQELQHLAGPTDRPTDRPTDTPDTSLPDNEGKPHIASRAKKAAAFFRMSRSARSRTTSFFKAAITAGLARSRERRQQEPRSIPVSSAEARSRRYPDHGQPRQQPSPDPSPTLLV